MNANTVDIKYQNTAFHPYLQKNDSITKEQQHYKNIVIKKAKPLPPIRKTEIWPCLIFQY